MENESEALVKWTIRVKQTTIDSYESEAKRQIKEADGEKVTSACKLGREALENNEPK